MHSKYFSNSFPFSSILFFQQPKAMPLAKISPSMLSCDFANLAAEARRMTKNGADWLHLGKAEKGVEECF
jgi:hypothetical protein